MAIKYKGFIINPVYSICADWKLDKNNKVVPRRPKKEDIEYYEILDPMQDGDRWIAEDTVSLCKSAINDFLASVNMKSNHKKEWDKLDQ